MYFLKGVSVKILKVIRYINELLNVSFKDIETLKSVWPNKNRFVGKEGGMNKKKTLLNHNLIFLLCKIFFKRRYLTEEEKKTVHCIFLIFLML